jgi:RecA/RadA recombinase
MSSLTERMLKSTALKGRSEVLATSTMMEGRKLVPTSIPMLNVALSGSFAGGLGCGLTTIAGPSRHFKTLFGLQLVAAHMKHNKESICIFYDSEFGAGKDYFESNQIDADRVIHIPIMNIEELKFDIIAKLEDLDKKDDVIIFIDSIGNLASKKEVEDAKDEKSVADMTRAKMMKGLFRMVTPYLNLKNIPMIAVNHVYQTQEMFSKAVVSGGTGIMLSSDNVWIIGRQQEKEGKDIVGYNFIINVEKSRYVKEKSKIPITVTFEGGINKWSGLLPLAVQTGHVIKPSNGWYTRPHIDGDKKFREAETNTSAFWMPIMTDTDYPAAVEALFKLKSSGLVKDDE